ncbi:hypothetical protein [Bdellovibrio sp. NC01]|uniref:hypothetical protein n=1 Tax=Bdellovibrio sp. NC01 TaxID=2220073 RepID=UPI0011588DB4|nr:hypothetical protein [Bdellovibrio sp. NC01]QDK36864.1 hypothetical protein DOE51_04295 [Bdellovibrio sp. NC01]
MPSTPPKSDIHKVAVIGNSSGGKTRLARKLAQSLQLPLTHVDSIQFVEGMKIRPYKESIAIIKQIQNQDRWIIDGYGPLDILVKRLELADKIVMIDFPLWRHYWWAAKRQIQNLWSRREELPTGCDERSWDHTVKLFKTIKSAHKQMRPELLRILSRPALKDKVVMIQTMSNWNHIYNEGLK